MGNSRTLTRSAGRLLVLAALVAGTAYPLAPVGAAKPTKISFPVEVTYEIPELTELCGVEVWFTLEGTFKGLLFRDRSGVVVREHNSQPDTWLNLWSPETGESIRNPFAARFHYRYPDGTDVGDRVVIRATGFSEKLPGLPAKAGQLVFEHGVVVAVEDGVPLVDYGEPTWGTPGNDRYSFEEADAAICAALAG